MLRVTALSPPTRQIRAIADRPPRRQHPVGRLTVRDEHYTPFHGSRPSDPQQREAVTVFVLAPLHSDRTDWRRGSLRAGPHGWDAVLLVEWRTVSDAVVPEAGIEPGRAFAGPRI